MKISNFLIQTTVKSMQSKNEKINKKYKEQLKNKIE